MSSEVPTELAEWVEVRLDLIAKTVREAQKIHARGGNSHDWLLDLLTELANVEAVARRGVHLLTAYGQREQVAIATELAKASNVTISTAQSRNGSRLAQEAYNEVFNHPLSREHLLMQKIESAVLEHGQKDEGMPPAGA